MNDAAEIEEAPDERYPLLFNVRRSIRYHMRREAFFSGWHNVTSAAGVIFGSAAVGALVTRLDNRVALYAAAMVAVFSAIDLVIGTAEKARRHNDLRRRFVDLERKIIAKQANMETLQDEYLAIEADEPPVLRALDTICHNDLLQAEGHKEGFVDIPWHERITAHFINWPVERRP
ncbi:MAG TPA: hypothetical protein ENK05_11710 [Gammaproteobacteria bacterium]|nr:hypothetical protein [Gammaproteobacteria bacterium]